MPLRIAGLMGAASGSTMTQASRLRIDVSPLSTSRQQEVSP